MEDDVVIDPGIVDEALEQRALGSTWITEDSIRPVCHEAVHEDLTRAHESLSEDRSGTIILATTGFERCPSPPPAYDKVPAHALVSPPRRLVIAGIDLFADPAGSYPRQIDIPNAYVPVHDREAELSIIRAALDRHTGEAKIIGDVLCERLGCT